MSDDKSAIMFGPTEVAGAIERNLRELHFHIQSTNPLGVDIQASMSVLDRVGDYLEKLHEMQQEAAARATAAKGGEARTN